jgi:hypothetical protein
MRTGSWPVPHVEASRAAARTATATGKTAAAMAVAELAFARGDLHEGLSSTAVARDLAQVEFPGVADWRALELDALIGLGRLDDADAALAELGAVPASGLPSALLSRSPCWNGMMAAACDGPVIAGALSPAGARPAASWPAWALGPMSRPASGKFRPAGPRWRQGPAWPGGT